MISIKISLGELFDRISILDIKVKRITDPTKLAAVRSELASLNSVLASTSIVEWRAIIPFVKRLSEVNLRLWDVEDALREHERANDFGPKFVELARSVYVNNDERAECKRLINEKTSSDIVEVKSYTPYLNLQ